MFVLFDLDLAEIYNIFFAYIKKSLVIFIFSLGVLDHDGDNDNINRKCSSDDQYIMAGRISELNATNFQNTFRFSSCSIEWLRKYLFQRLIIIIVCS